MCAQVASALESARVLARDRTAIFSARYAASRPTPAIIIELKAYWKASPQKNSPGAPSATPRYSCGQPSATDDGHVEPVVHLAEAGTPDDVGDVEDPAVVEDRCAVAYPDDAGRQPFHFRCSRSSRVTRIIGPPWKRTSSISRRPIGVRLVIR